jgi:SAM-dependent methyltransferase
MPNTDTASPQPSTTKLYWKGNVAKARILNEILARTSGDCVVFDFGAGAGGDWPEILADFPKLELVAYEPFAPSAARLRTKLNGLAATVVEDIGTANIHADFVVSFSVFEHVFDRLAYLRQARKALKPSGSMFLNYDDGHFRQNWDLSRPGSWLGPLREHTRNQLAPLWPKLGRVHMYQARVARQDCDELVAEAGFVCVGERYENLASLKNMAKTIPEDRANEFTRFWLNIEDELNAKFRAPIQTEMGDSVNLWREMASRTLELRPAQK